VSISSGGNVLGDRNGKPMSPFRLGIVKAQDLSGGRLRVIFNEFDHMTSYWLPVVVSKTQNDKAYWLPDLGEQVVCLMDERDEVGVVLGAIYSQADTTPVQSADKFHLGFKDGTSMEYDRAAHVLAINFQDTTIFKYDGGAHVLTLNFEDQTSLGYDAAAHSLALTFSDGMSIRYDATTHTFSLTGVSATSVAIEAPAGITLQSGSSFLTVLPTGVSVNPPLT
jgi:phage baseplate assembly protein gpV